MCKFCEKFNRKYLSGRAEGEAKVLRWSGFTRILSAPQNVWVVCTALVAPQAPADRKRLWVDSFCHHASWLWVTFDWTTSLTKKYISIVYYRAIYVGTQETINGLVRGIRVYV